MANNPDVSVIIVNYRTTNLIISCLKSLFRLTKGVSFEIIIVDNASEQDFNLRISSEFPDKTDKMCFIPLPENIGFGRANNKGIEKAHGRNILFLNPDTVLINNAIGILCDFLDNHSNVGACGGNLLSEQMSPNLSFRRILPGIRWEINELLNCIPEKLLYGTRSRYETSDKPCKVGYITGADLMVKRDILNKTGAFHPDFFMYYEETDLCARIKRHGWDIYCVPTARIQHLDGQSFIGSPSVNHFKIETQEYSRATYYRLNSGKLKRAAADFFYGLYLLTRTILLHKGTKKESYRTRLRYFLRHRHQS